MKKYECIINVDLIIKILFCLIKIINFYFELIFLTRLKFKIKTSKIKVFLLQKLKSYKKYNSFF